MAFDLVDVVHKLFLSSVLNSIDVGNFISWSCSSSSGTSSVKVLSSRQRFALINVWRSIVTCHWSEMLVQSFPFTCVFSEVFCVCVCVFMRNYDVFYVLKLCAWIHSDCDRLVSKRLAWSYFQDPDHPVLQCPLALCDPASVDEKDRISYETSAMFKVKTRLIRFDMFCFWFLWCVDTCFLMFDFWICLFLFL